MWVHGLYIFRWFCVHKLSMFIYLSMMSSLWKYKENQSMNKSVRIFFWLLSSEFFLKKSILSNYTFVKNSLKNTSIAFLNVFLIDFCNFKELRQISTAGHVASKQVLILGLRENFTEKSEKLWILGRHLDSKVWLYIQGVPNRIVISSKLRFSLLIGKFK